MRVVFFGTPAFAVPSLLAAAADHTIVGVVTQPDRPHGRSRSKLVAPPVKDTALQNGWEVQQPETPRDAAFLDTLTSWNPDIGVVVAYGHILRPNVLDIPNHGMLNVHASLLPAWRGAAPVHYAIMNGLKETGVTIMRMDEGMDSGDIVRAASIPIEPTDTTGTLTPRLAQLGADELAIALRDIESGMATYTPQDHDAATFAPKVTRDSARIDWDRTADDVANLIRAMDPAPGAWCTHDASPVKLFNPEVLGDSSGPPGTTALYDGRIIVHCGDGAVAVERVQPSGKQRMAGEAWLRGLAAGAPPVFQ